MLHNIVEEGERLGIDRNDFAPQEVQYLAIFISIKIDEKVDMTDVDGQGVRTTLSCDQVSNPQAQD